MKENGSRARAKRGYTPGIDPVAISERNQRLALRARPSPRHAAIVPSLFPTVDKPNGQNTTGDYRPFVSQKITEEEGYIEDIEGG